MVLSNGEHVNHRFNLLPTLQSEVLIGYDLLQRIGIRLVDKNHKDIILANTNESDMDICSAIKSRGTLSLEQESRLNSLLQEMMGKSATVTGCTNLTEHVIRMKTDVPIKQRYFSKNPKMVEIIHQQIDELIKNGQIEPSASAYSSSIVLVKKKDSSWRMCIDYRKINDHSERDAYPMPQISAILNRMKEAKYLSAIDLKNGYWQIPIRPESRQYTAFTVPGKGLYQWKVMPFGLHAAPATFQSLLDRVIVNDFNEFATAYLDDIIVFSKTFEEHLRHVQLVLERLSSANLKINVEKSTFCKDELKYLGHIIGNSGIKTDPEKVQAIKELPPPKDVSGVRRILGMVTWYAKFIENFTLVVRPLQELLKKSVKFEWKTEHQNGLDAIKSKMTNAPMIACPDYDHPFYLQTDASNVGLGAVLFQRIGDQEVVISYSSRSLRQAENNYTTTEKECLAIIWGIEKNREYLEGIPFTVITDHLALKWIFGLPNPTGRVGRWVLELQNYDFSIEYRKGKDNVVPDVLSRAPLLVEKELSELCNVTEEEAGCPWISRMMARVKANPEKYSEYLLQDETLLKNCGSTEFGITPWKLCVPTPLRTKVMHENHSHITAGHFGVRKTIQRISQKYHWPGMYKDVEKFIGQCRICLEHKIPQTKPAGTMHTTQVQEPWEVVTVDYIGPFPRSTKGFRHLLIIQDKLTNWVEITPVQNATAPGLIRIIREKILGRFGWPKTLISDNGSQFIRKLFKTFLKENKIRHQLTPPYSPQCNSTERVNRVIKTVIKVYLDKGEHRKWDANLSEVQFAINTAVQQSTGFSPAYLNLGRNPRIPSSVYEDCEIRPGVVNFDPNELGTRMKETLQLVKNNMARASVMQAKHYNLRRRDWQPAVEELVYKKMFHLSNAANNFAAKLAPSFSGPFIVHNYVSPTVVELKEVGRKSKKIFRAHLKDLKEIDQRIRT